MKKEDENDGKQKRKLGKNYVKEKKKPVTESILRTSLTQSNSLPFTAPGTSLVFIRNHHLSLS
jgi:hypothetical protein